MVRLSVATYVAALVVSAAAAYTPPPLQLALATFRQGEAWQLAAVAAAMASDDPLVRLLHVDEHEPRPVLLEVSNDDLTEALSRYERLLRNEDHERELEYLRHLHGVQPRPSVSRSGGSPTSGGRHRNKARVGPSLAQGLTVTLTPSAATNGRDSKSDKGRLDKQELASVAKTAPAFQGGEAATKEAEAQAMALEYLTSHMAKTYDNDNCPPSGRPASNPEHEAHIVGVWAAKLNVKGVKARLNACTGMVVVRHLCTLHGVSGKECESLTTKYMMVNTELQLSTSLRRIPSPESPTTGEVRGNSPLLVIEERQIGPFSWGLVRSSLGMEGWVVLSTKSADAARTRRWFVESKPLGTEYPALFVALKASAPLRLEPTQSSTKAVATIDLGSAVEVLGEQGAFLKVEYCGGVRWISRDDVARCSSLVNSESLFEGIGPNKVPSPAYPAPAFASLAADGRHQPLPAECFVRSPPATSSPGGSVTPSGKTALLARKSTVSAGGANRSSSPSAGGKSQDQSGLSKQSTTQRAGTAAHANGQGKLGDLSSGKAAAGSSPQAGLLSSGLSSSGGKSARMNAASNKGSNTGKTANTNQNNKSTSPDKGSSTEKSPSDSTGREAGGDTPGKPSASNSGSAPATNTPGGKMPSPPGMPKVPAMALPKVPASIAKDLGGWSIADLLKPPEGVSLPPGVSPPETVTPAQGSCIKKCLETSGAGLKANLASGGAGALSGGGLKGAAQAAKAAALAAAAAAAKCGLCCTLGICLGGTPGDLLMTALSASSAAGPK